MQIRVIDTQFYGKAALAGGNHILSLRLVQLGLLIGLENGWAVFKSAEEIAELIGQPGRGAAVRDRLAHLVKCEVLEVEFLDDGALKVRWGYVVPAVKFEPMKVG